MRIVEKINDEEERRIGGGVVMERAVEAVVEIKDFIGLTILRVFELLSRRGK